MIWTAILTVIWGPLTHEIWTLGDLFVAPAQSRRREEQAAARGRRRAVCGTLSSSLLPSLPPIVPQFRSLLLPFLSSPILPHFFTFHKTKVKRLLYTRPQIFLCLFCNRKINTAKRHTWAAQKG